MKSREDVLNTHQDYNILCMVGDIICAKCWSKLRLKKSIENKNQPEESSTTNSHTITSNETIDIENSQMSSLSLTNVEQSASQGFQYFTSSSEERYASECSQVTVSSGSVYSILEKIPVETVSMPFPRTAITRSYCFLCQSREEQLQAAPLKARLQTFVKRRIFIPKRNKCCKKHLINSRFYENDLFMISSFENECLIETTELGDFLNNLSDNVDSSIHDQIKEFEMSEERVRVLTGLSWENIITLKEIMVGMRNSDNRNILQALVTFLIKLRTGNSDRCVGAILDIDE